MEISSERPLIGIVMGSDSDWPTMSKAADVLKSFDIPYEAKVVSAHRTPELMYEYAQSAEERGLAAIIAGAGGAAHLPGMLASLTTIPLLGVPIETKHLSGQDSLLSIVQMPKGIPVATFAIGEAGPNNAALFAIAMLAKDNIAIEKKLKEFRNKQSDSVLKMNLE